MGKGVGPLLFVALLVASAVGPGSTPDRAERSERNLPGPLATDLRTVGPSSGVEGRSAEAGEELARPEYPSSQDPGLLGSGIGPRPLLANAIASHHFDDAWSLGFRGAGIHVAVVDDGVDFGNLDLQGTQAVVTNASSPYVGWPIAYDPKSLGTYLLTGYPDGTWFANTTRVGLGPFDVVHTIKVDGTNDFGDRERWGKDAEGQSTGDADGAKIDYDLQDLYATRDDDDWFVGFPVFLNDQNASFVLLIDTDNETSGAHVSPGGFPVDTNTSHENRVNDVAWSPDGTKVASVGGDRRVRIWNRTGALLRTMGGDLTEPETLSVAWSPDGAKVASADKNRLRIWDASTGTLIHDIGAPGYTGVEENGVLAFSPNGTWIAAASPYRILVFSVATGARFGSVWPGNFDVNAVAFNPQGDRMAVALGDNSARVYAMVPATFNTGAPATALYTLAGPSGHTQPVLDVAWSPDGTRIVTTAKDDRAKLWDVAGQAVLRDLTGHNSWVLSADWSPSGAGFVTSSQGLGATPPSFAIWDSGGNLVRLVNQTRPLPAVNWSVGDEIATAGEDVTARLWTSAGDFIRILVAHRPDYALFTHGFSQYSDRESKYVHGTELAVWYRWDVPSGSWVAESLANLGGRQSALQVGAALFNEFAIPRSLLAGDPAAISMELFSAFETGSRAQDTVPSDPNVDFQGIDPSPGWSSLSTFAWREIRSYQVSGLTTASNAFHFGFHPGPAVQREFGALGVLVADSAQPGKYDRVYLDMNDDKVFDLTDVVVSKASPIAAIDNYNATAGGPGEDTYPDVSAGMIYFISDGVNPIPYSARLQERKSSEGLLLRIPASGDLVAFAGDFGVNPITTALSEHGTRMAGAIVAQGRLPTPIVGTANNATLIAILNGLSDPIEAWTFAVEGYDARPNTGDEATVVVSGFNYATIHHDGWDVYSRTADYLSTQTSNGSATFVASVGDSGYGYGTALAPASGPSVIAAGRAGDFSLRSMVYGGIEGPNAHVRDPAVAGSRGPSAQGFVKPELLAVDTAIVSIPLHSASQGSAAYTSVPMVGSDVSAALVAGAVAIVQEAFAAAHGRTPRVDEVRAILMSGADDMGHDVLSQGAGFLNVSRSVKLAAETADAGLEASPPTWHPGTYNGVSHPGFTRLMLPGDWEALDFDVANRGGAPITAGVEAVAFTRSGVYSHTNVTRTDLYQPEGDVALWVNDTGLWKVNGTTFAAVQLAAPIPGAWSNADLVKVTAYSDLSRLTQQVGTSFLVNYSYTLRALDWTIDWANPKPPIPAPASFPGELNTIAETFHQSNVLEVRAAFPAIALHTGLVITLESADPSLAIEGLAWTFEIEFYERTPWPWVSVPASITVPARSSAILAANLSVPGGADLGSYEGEILIRDPVRGVTTIPILVNVGADGPRLTFGGNLVSADLYDNSRMFGGYDRALSSATRLRRPTLGDWRFFFFDIPAQGVWEAPTGYKLLVRTGWVDAPSDVDIFAFGRNPSADLATQGNGGWYGPMTLRQAGKTEELDKPEFKTATGGGEEVLAYDLSSGLNVIALRGFAMRGLEAEVRLLSGEGGWVNTPTGVNVATRFLRCDVANATVFEGGCGRLAFMSNMDLPGLRASAVGPAQTTSFSELPIAQDVQSWWVPGPWGDWMRRGSFTYVVDVQKALILEVAIQGKVDVSDLDLAVFRNADGAPCEWDPALVDPLTGLEGYWKTCELEPEEYLLVDPTKWNTDADGDADERVKWTSPADGQYFVKVLGYTVLANPGHFDLQVSVTLDTGTGYRVDEAPAGNVTGTMPVLPALTRVPMNMTWDFPIDTEDDAYGGAVLLGLPNAPGVIVVPAVVLLDRRAPEVVGLKVSALSGRLSAADNRTTNDPAPQLAVSVQDLDWGQLDRTSPRLVLDGVDMTGIASIGIFALPRGGKVGYWEGTLSLAPPTPLDEGNHTLNATVADRTGNVVTANFTFAIDATAPTLTIAGAPLQYTTSDTHVVTGTTEPDAFVNVRGVWYDVGPTGSFQVPVPLLEGTNALTVTVTDWFEIDASGNQVAGNFVTVLQTIVRDIRVPEIVYWGPDPAGTTRATETVVTGLARDPFAASEFGRPQDIAMVLNSPGFSGPVPVQADGTFRVVVPLAEGANAITATLRDLVGNELTTSISVTSDTIAPDLSVVSTPGTVQTSVLTVRGTAEAGAFVTVNGILAVSAPGGAFSKDVALSRGRNVVVVQAVDIAGNVATRQLVVTYQADTGIGLGLAAGIAAAGAAIGLLVAFALSRAGVRIPLLSRKSREGGPNHEAPAEALSEPAEEAGPAEPATPEELAGDPRAARLRAAYDEGIITKEVYEENLRRLKGRGGP